MRELHRVLLSELSSLGLSPRVHTTAGNHTCVEWDIAGKTNFIVTSTTPSDRRAVLNARADMRRRLKASGLLHETQPPKPVPLNSPAAHLRNELAELRSGTAVSSVSARIRTIEIELAWRAHA